ncbi:hypothetical protein [Mycobacterium riyadhense]|uniref:hypothetical protein n=1 Tax=Mycobacterium riyadhense TaxID=486698 RepID=UPI001956A5D8|nr:hypothetical protein [Mycobacterium riyadhense]
MEEWGRPTPPPAAPRPEAPAAPGAPSPGLPSAGFGAAFRSLVSRKLNELRGRRWEGASERARQAEAARRGAAEMARRIERQTGRRPAEATIRRNARLDRTPRGADQARLDRQSRIDAAGGVKQFAQKAGAKTGRAARWRDSGASMVPTGVRVTADVGGVLWADGQSYDRALTASVSITGPAADELRAAYAAGDTWAVAELLGQPITTQVDWAGEAERRYQVDEITEITVT